MVKVKHLAGTSLGNTQAFHSICSSGSSSRQELNVKPVKHSEKSNDPIRNLTKKGARNTKLYPTRHKTNKSFNQTISIQRLSHKNSLIGGDHIKLKTKVPLAVKCTTPRLNSALYIERYRILQKCKVAAQSSRKSSVEPTENSLGLKNALSKKNLYDVVPKIDEEDLTNQHDTIEELNLVSKDKKVVLGKRKSSTAVSGVKIKPSLGKYKIQNGISKKNEIKALHANYSTVHTNPPKLRNSSKKNALCKEKVANNDVVSCNSFIKSSRNQGLNLKESAHITQNETTKSFYRGTLNTTKSDKNTTVEGKLARSYLEELYRRVIAKSFTENKPLRALQKLQNILNNESSTTKVSRRGQYKY